MKLLGMRVLGMISGTSHDGIDCAVVRFEPEADLLRATVEHHDCLPYPAALRERLRAALPPASLTFAEACALDTLIGQAFAHAAAQVLTRAEAELICSHGQTVFHWVEDTKVLGTLQLGQPAWIAERTGLPVVADLRSRDVAAGGQGAPLVALLDLLALTQLPGRPAALNLGGIANLTVPLPHPEPLPEPLLEPLAGPLLEPLLEPLPRPVAYDLGPANALIDAAAWHACGQPYDHDGRLAASGRVDPDLLAALLAEPFYALPPPKTTGKELFHLPYLESFLTNRRLEGDDIVATVTALTAEVVAAEVKRHTIDTVVASGGGCANPTLMAMLRANLDGVTLVTSDAIGCPPEAKEAIAFALLGYYTAHGLPATIPSCTGARAPRILGSITPGSGALTLPPTPPTPSRLQITTD